MSSPNTIDKFNALIEKTDYCWIWKGNIMKSGGYGRFCFQGRRWRTHVLSLFLHKKILPQNGQEVCHKCDNPKCVNPNHLFLGTHKENMEDMHKKGRAKGLFQAGELSMAAKLTNTDIINIRKEYIPHKITMKDLAKKYNVAKGTIYLIIHKKKWSHI